MIPGAAVDGISSVFAKGLAVQHGVAYFNVSGSRNPKQRQALFSTLLVAYDLQQKKELWVRTLTFSGLVNQIVSLGYLNADCAGKGPEGVCFTWPVENEETTLQSFMEQKIKV